MTLTTLITVNALLGLGLVAALVSLLGHGIHADRRTRREHTRAQRPPIVEHDRLAA